PGQACEAEFGSVPLPGLRHHLHATHSPCGRDCAAIVGALLSDHRGVYIPVESLTCWQPVDNLEVSPRICYFPKGLGACRPAALKHVSKKRSHQRHRPVILPGGVEETRKPQHRTPVLTDTHSQGRQFVGTPPEPS